MQNTDSDALVLTGSGGIEGRINAIQVNNGSIINSSSSGNIKLIFGEFNIANGGISTIGFNLIGTGTTWLTGNVINTGSAETGFVIGNNINSPSLTLQLGCFFAGSGSNVFIIDTPNGGFNLNCQDFRSGTSGDITTTCFNILTGNVNLNGGNYVFNSTSSPAIILTNNARLTTTLGQVQSDNTLILCDTSNYLWYQASNTNVNNNVPVIDVTSPSGEEITVCGRLNTPNANCILFNGANAPNIFRVINATLVSTTNCIASTALMTAIINPSISNTDVTISITKIPAGTLFIDAGVN